MRTYLSTLALLCLCSLLPACRDEPSAAPAAAYDGATSAAGTSPAPTTPIAADTHVAAGAYTAAQVSPEAPATTLTPTLGEWPERPRAPVRLDICPGEYCQYGAWTTTAPMPIYRHERDRSQVMVTLPADTTMQALDGYLWFTRIGQAKVVSADNTGGDGALKAGELLDVFDGVGEGEWRIWRHGELGTIAQILQNDEDAPRDGEEIRWEHKPKFAWWVRVRLADGREGWLRLDDHSPQVLGTTE